ncbi:MAG TPA: hypothetical protein PKI59_02405 [Candidatus Cloacimonadota bacterium]|jgi:hypothetical protein|nr:hypothetical protein [Candidatus Cloacimonadota bacterium]
MRLNSAITHALGLPWDALFIPVPYIIPGIRLTGKDSQNTGLGDITLRNSQIKDKRLDTGLGKILEK